MADITQQLQQQILDARNEGRKLQIIGGNSKAFLGREPSGDVLSVAEHHGIVNYQPLELVITVRAGTLLSEIEATLAEQDQMLSFEPPLFTEHATIGGTLACNLSGPGRPWGGSVRDQVLGVRMFNGKGEDLHFGGQVMKNVAGYDASRLQAGAMGTLGLLTEISLKVLPRHAMTMTLVEDISATDAIRLMNERARQAKPITAACWLGGRLFTRLAGAASAVLATAEQWSGEPYNDDPLFWSALRDQRLPWFDDTRPLWRFSVKSTAEHWQPDGNWLIDWGGSQRWLKSQGELTEKARQATAAGGQVSLFQGGNRQQEVFHPQPQALQQIQQRLKHNFDPDGIFNPGRLYSWL